MSTPAAWFIADPILSTSTDARQAMSTGRGLEAVVFKWKASAYRSGPRSGWIKVKS
jgi:ATP-dependent DNA ligase